MARSSGSPRSPSRSISGRAIPPEWKALHGQLDVVSELQGALDDLCELSRAPIQRSCPKDYALGDVVRARIRDDGVGGADPARGSGLVGVRDQVEALGGSMVLVSSPGEGTSVLVDLPISPSNDTMVSVASRAAR
jgi:nitrate/nitrite-specific signal transduction histidine kinase